MHCLAITLVTKITFFWNVMPCNLVDKFISHGVTTQNTVILILTVVRTGNLIRTHIYDFSLAACNQ
jgi:uncharacterized membrane protein YwzB